MTDEQRATLMRIEVRDYNEYVMESKIATPVGNCQRLVADDGSAELFVCRAGPVPAQEIYHKLWELEVNNPKLKEHDLMVIEKVLRVTGFSSTPK